MAFRNESKKFSKPRLGCGCARFHCQMTRITTTKQAAFTANTEFGPINESQMPPRAGPKIPEMFSCNPPSVVAERSSFWETISVTIEDQAGAANAKPTPIRNTDIRTTEML